MNDAELLRYSRHIFLPQVDIAGQQSIIDSTALIVGLGGLGSPVALYLAAAGVGTLILCDDDVVDESNLQRQVIHNETTVGKTKVASAMAALETLNHHIEITPLTQRMGDAALSQVIVDADVIVDCSDNFATRNQINRLCFKHSKPLVSGAAIRMEGQVSVFDFRDETAPCYNCLYNLTGEENLRCAESGVFGPLVGVVGTTQALEALKILSGMTTQGLKGKLGLYDGVNGQWRYIKLRKDPTCKTCKLGQTRAPAKT